MPRHTYTHTHTHTHIHTHTHTHTQTHSSLFNRDAKTSTSRCSPAPGRSRLAQRPLAHLIQAVDFLGGIHDFPAAGALGVHCRGSRGRRLGGGWGLRGAAVTSPGEPRTASGQAGGRRAAGRGAGGRAGGAARGEAAAARVGAQRGLAPEGSAALLGSGSAPARAPRRSLCAALTPGTGDSHRHSLPPLALTRSPASPPRRRPNPPARPDRSGRERARRTPGEGGRSGGGGRADARKAPQTARPGGLGASLRPLPQQGRPGGRRRRFGGQRGAGRAQARALLAPHFSSLLPQPVPPTHSQAD